MYKRIEITNPKGINRDLSPFELPPEIWSDGRNINFRRNRTNRQLGYRNPFVLNGLSVSPLWVGYFHDGVKPWWVYASEAAIVKTDGVTNATLSSGFNATRDDNWYGCNFNSVLVMNNKNDHPQYLPETPFVPFAFDTVDPLPFWGTPAADTIPEPAHPAYRWGDNSRCELIRAHKNYLFALNCYDVDGEHYHSMVRWSSPAQLGDVPPSWDPTSPSEQAGLYVLSDSPGVILDGKTLGDYFVVYKTDAVWLIQFIGGAFNFSFRKLFSDDAGMLAHECVAEFEGQHFVMSPTGAYVHNGSSKQEIMEPWVKDQFFKNVNIDLMKNTRVIADHNNSEIWVYYTTKDSSTGWCDQALVWNWTTQLWTIRELTGISYIAEGIVTPTEMTSDTWDSDAESWEQDQTSWNSSQSVDPTELGLVLTDYVNNQLYANETDNKQAGQVMTGWVERIGIDFDDDFQFKYLSRVIPHIEGSTPVTITLYASNIQDRNPVIQQVSVFDPVNDWDVDSHLSGRYLGIRFSCDGDFILNGYTLVFTVTGQQ